MGSDSLDYLLALPLMRSGLVVESLNSHAHFALFLQLEFDCFGLLLCDTAGSLHYVPEQLLVLPLGQHGPQVCTEPLAAPGP